MKIQHATKSNVSCDVRNRPQAFAADGFGKDDKGDAMISVYTDGEKSETLYSETLDSAIATAREMMGR